MSGVAALGRGRTWHDEVDGPTIPSERFGPVARLLRNSSGPVAIAALPIQLFGLVAVVVALPIMGGAVPSQEAPRLAVVVMLVGIFLMTLATVLIRVAVWLGHRNRGG